MPTSLRQEIINQLQGEQTFVNNTGYNDEQAMEFLQEELYGKRADAILLAIEQALPPKEQRKLYALETKTEFFKDGKAVGRNSYRDEVLTLLKGQE